MRLDWVCLSMFEENTYRKHRVEPKEHTPGSKTLRLYCNTVQNPSVQLEPCGKKFEGTITRKIVRKINTNLFLQSVIHRNMMWV